MNKIGINAKKLMFSDLVYVLTSVFIDTFLVAYLLNITNDNLTIVSLYYIVVYSLRAIGNVLIGYYVKSHQHKSKQVVIIGIIFRAFFILIISLLTTKIKKYMVLIAVIYSISETFYWCAHELLYIELTNNKNRKSYMSIKKILSKVVNIVTPIILGASIEVFSFIKISTYVFLLSLIQIILVLSISINLKKTNKEKYNLLVFLDFIKINKIKKIDNYGNSGVYLGIIENAISTLIIFITIKTFKTSFNLGVLTTIFAIFSMIVLLLYKKFYNKKNSHFILALCCVIFVTGVLGLLIEFKKFTLVLYNFCYIIAFSVFDVIYNTKKGNLVKECSLENYRVEYINYASITILIGRIVGYLLIFILSFIDNSIFLKILLVILTLSAPFYCYSMYKIEKDK